MSVRLVDKLIRQAEELIDARDARRLLDPYGEEEKAIMHQVNAIQIKAEQIAWDIYQQNEQIFN